MAETVQEPRAYHRYPVAYPVIFGGAPFVGEGTVADLSLTGCSVVCNRTALAGSYVKLSMILPDPTLSLFIELGKIRWVRANSFGVEFIRFPTLTRHRLDRVIEKQLTSLLENRAEATSRTASHRIPQSVLKRSAPNDERA